MRKQKLIMNCKKAVSLIMASVMVLSIAACGGGDEGEKETTEKQTEEETESLEPEIERPDKNTVTSYDVENTDYTLSIDAGNEVHDISELLYGIFIEDINFAADGGLYAEKVVNRSFEFTQLAENDEMYGWSTVGTINASVTVDDKTGSLNENNTNYLVMENTSGTLSGVANRGFLDGMSVEKDGEYNFSIYVKGIDGYTGGVTVNITSGTEVIATGKIDSVTSEWKKYTLSLTSSKEAHSGVTLQVLIDNGKAAVDMVSLFPKDTYKGRENGMRKDLAEMLEALQPKFLRFPGGCVIEGYDADSAYNWKDSIGVGQNGEPLLFNGTYGDVAAREQGINIWTDINATEDKWPSFMTYGLGFFEYFQFAEDLGAIGVPVVNCGLYCQARGGEAVPIDSDEFKQYIQDALDLVEFCRGGADTKWGSVRIAMGHEEPFALKYIGIGNENWGEDYYERYTAFAEAFANAKNEQPELFEGIEIMYSAGVDDGTSGADYMPSYQYAKEWLENNPDSDISDFAGATDHHYYNDPEWFLKNTDYYDEENYSRDTESMTSSSYGGGINVFLGEYAARSNTLKAALAEAAYMTGLERNGDIVKMAAYAPLFGNLTATHWAPDLIWFNNNLCTGSISYYMQKIFSTNAGTKLLSSNIEGASVDVPELAGMVGVGTWNTAATFDNVSVVNNDTGEVLGEQDFEEDTFKRDWYQMSDGDFKVEDGELVQSSTSTIDSNIGSSVYFGYTDWENYTYTVSATKTAGDEGFLIPFAVQGRDNNYFWNLGGWGNTVSCLQQVTDGTKSGQVEGTIKDFTAKTGETYELKVVVSGKNVKCYVDDELYIDYNVTAGSEAEAYQVVSTDDTGDIIIKLVNVTESDRVFAVDIANAGTVSSEAIVYQVAGNSLDDDNILGAKEDCIMEEMTISGFSDKFNYTVPKYSVTVIRIDRN